MKPTQLSAVLGSLASNSIIPRYSSSGVYGKREYILEKSTFSHLISCEEPLGVSAIHYQNVVYDSKAGVFWHDNDPIPELITTFTQSNIREGLQPPCGKDLPWLDENIVVNSVVCPHYGHFLIESTGWLWPLFFPWQCDCQHIVAFQSDTRLSKDLLSAILPPRIRNGIQAKVDLARLFYSNYFIHEFFSLLNSAIHPRREFKYLSASCKISSLYVPSTTFRFGCEPHDLHRLPFAAIASHVQATDMRCLGIRSRLGQAGSHQLSIVYFSRLGFSASNKHARKIINEEYLHWLLSAMGASVVYPERLSLRDQISVINQATVLVGCESSALHTVLFSSRETKLRRMITLRAPQRSLKTFLGVDQLIRALGIESVYIPALLIEKDERRHLNYANVRYCQNFDQVLVDCIEEVVRGASVVS